MKYTGWLCALSAIGIAPISIRFTLPSQCFYQASAFAKPVFLPSPCFLQDDMISLLGGVF